MSSTRTVAERAKPRSSAQRPRPRGVVFAVIFGALTFACSNRTAPSAEQAVDIAAGGVRSITGDRLHTHMAVLADDTMQGRETGTPGFDLAAAYVVEQFRKLGLSPVNGTYTQTIAITRYRPVERETTLTFTIDGETEELAHGRDFVTYGMRGTSGVTALGPIVFVGHAVAMPAHEAGGKVAPEANGAIALSLPGAPQATASERSYFGRSQQKSAAAAAQGFQALLLFDDPNIPWELRVRAAQQLGVSESLEIDRRPSVPVVFLSRPAAEKLLGRLDGIGLREGAALGTARLELRQEVTVVESANVVAVWPGSSSHASEHVVVSAHLDHIGIGAPVNGDSIYNGAVDNASGVASLITMAEALTSIPTRPRRNILFLATTAEEQGLLGSDAFLGAPFVPIRSIVAAINVDGTSISRAARHSGWLQLIARTCCRGRGAAAGVGRATSAARCRWQ